MGEVVHPAVLTATDDPQELELAGGQAVLGPHLDTEDSMSKEQRAAVDALLRSAAIDRQSHTRGTARGFRRDDGR
ncbi:hypothetical protein [Streptomyces mirabilis]|uniref:hypothetical protein n=1 Tax=Streptomyces mirabilis TaxID=68239 RepID=UPI00333077B5